jgi:hypothetical protein
LLRRGELAWRRPWAGDHADAPARDGAPAADSTATNDRLIDGMDQQLDSVNSKLETVVVLLRPDSED